MYRMTQYLHVKPSPWAILHFTTAYSKREGEMQPQTQSVRRI